MEKSKNTSLLLIYIFGAFGAILFGYDTGIISGAILYIKDDFKLNSVTQGFVISSILFGCVVGAASSGKIGDKFGRRKSIFISAIVFVIGTLGSAFSMNVEQMVISRVILGLAVGCVSASVPLYLSEIAPANTRGAISGLNQILIIFGMVVAYIVNFALANVTHGWRYMIALGVIPAIVLIIGVFFIPESPRWLFKIGRESDATNVLGVLRKGKNIDNEIEEIKQVCKLKEGSLKDLFSKQVRPALIIGTGLAFFQQVIGCNTIYYYAPTVISHTGLAKQASILGTVGIGTLNLIVTIIICSKVVDKVGRKKLLLIGNVGMSASLFLLWFVNAYSGSTLIVSYITIACLASYMIFFGLSFGPIIWIMIGEVFPLNVRSLGVAVSSTVNWLSNLLVSLSFPVLLQIMGLSCFGIYAVIGVISFIFVKTKVIETAGKSLEEIEIGLRSMKN